MRNTIDSWMNMPRQKKTTKKTRATKQTTRTRSERSAAADATPVEAAHDEVLAVLVDDKRGREYYVSMIDSFQISGRSYTVMYNFEPDIGTHPEPELVIMRNYQDENGDPVFVSIRSRKELDEAFDEFFRRYEQSL
ncbi:MAG: DUF1292 domain-containing protein [Saccharofermentanales bacterium]|nr:DUF1292 domain-containing protein [Bacillota bacterium]NLB08411.1 DUF1292 domain-containing protein [Clostridiales bacterium]